jgi:exopolyphosphatase/guanosine-5'-triphosphate,3'-diphosphate pyrophosphatase
LKLYLVRSGRAESRSGGRGADRRRALTEAGRLQAQGLAELLSGAPVDRILTSPAFRCLETVAPLAAERGLPAEVDERLAAGVRVKRTLELVHSLRDQPTVLCSHRGLILGLLEHFLDGQLPADVRGRCDDASVWILELPRVEATYLRTREPRTPRAGRRVLRAHRLPRLRQGAAPVRIAVLDLGSTSFHLLVAELEGGRSLKRIARKREMLRLGAELARNRRIPEPVLERAVAAARELRAFADRVGVTALVPVGTAVLREASNGSAFAARLGEALGTPVVVLDGGQEARLIFTAIRQRLGLGLGLTLGLDLGGGSLELAAGDASDVVFETTLGLGVARLAGALARPDARGRIERRSLEAVHRRVAAVLAPQRARLRRLEPRRCVAVGGTVRALARLLVEDRGSASIRGLSVSARELAELSDRLAGFSHEERLRMRSMDEQRADLLPVGAAILSQLLEELGFAGFTVCDWGLREGVILDLLGR